MSWPVRSEHCLPIGKITTHFVYQRKILPVPTESGLVFPRMLHVCVKKRFLGLCVFAQKTQMCPFVCFPCHESHMFPVFRAKKLGKRWPPIALESVYGLSASVCVRWGVETKKHSRTLTAKLKFSLPLSVCCLHYSKGHFISRGRLVLACLHCVLHTMMFYAVPH